MKYIFCIAAKIRHKLALGWKKAKSYENRIRKRAVPRKIKIK